MHWNTSIGEEMYTNSRSIDMPMSSYQAQNNQNISLLDERLLEDTTFDQPKAIFSKSPRDVFDDE